MDYEKTCENCGEKYTATMKSQKYCGPGCYSIAYLNPGNPLREKRCRKLGDATPKGFIESVVKSVAKHNKQMPQWTVHELLTGASMADRRSMPLSIPKHWRIGGFEDLRLVFESEDFKALCEKAELEFRYSHTKDVPVVIFEKAKQPDK